MVNRCRLCDDAFEYHFVVAAHSAAHWRGKSFDADQATGKLGVAIMDALGMDAADREDTARFISEVSVRDFREDVFGTGAGAGEGTGEGEDWEFHVGFHVEQSHDLREELKAAATDAVNASRNFEDAHVTAEDPTPGEAAEHAEDTEEVYVGGRSATGEAPDEHP